MRSDRSRRPKKSLGQNFLVDGNLQRKIVEALDPGPGDEILEIGPGKGALTRHLLGRCRSLFLVELDDELAASWEEAAEGTTGVRILHRDILGVDLRELTEAVGELKVVGNIPYNITTPIIFHLLELPRPKEILIMVQKEVAERILASPGTSAFGALSVGIRSVASVEKVLKVPASAFRPVPEVDSVVIRISPFRPHPLSPEEEEDLRIVTRAAFQRRRKQFQSILRTHPDLKVSRERLEKLEEATGLDFTRRPETFSPEDFIRLSRALRSL
ncbi:MAG: 16S rRNA (adenine(1518)-N(6)/adenine(1519)-N(6))-dimethyltransferase RsmA [Longimicrobiales bacterium]